MIDNNTLTAHANIMHSIQQLLQQKYQNMDDDSVNALHTEVMQLLLKLQGK